jgi:hypothetical protein
LKLTVFTGKDDWEVWFNRFEDVAKRLRWTTNDKLDELLPRIQGVAADFVYGQLARPTRNNYRKLTKELKFRFRKVETSKSYGARLSNRNQKPGERVEDFAAELKRLYDKAYPNRDATTRGEDLLRRFLDGLAEDRARFQVEYVKDPQDIDEAVFEVVNFQETRNRLTAGDVERKQRKAVRAA